MNITIATSADANAIGLLHKKLSYQKFSGSPWNQFLSLLYKSLSEFDGGIVITARESDQVIGFISGTTKTGRFYKYFLKQNFFAIGFTYFQKCLIRKY